MRRNTHLWCLIVLGLSLHACAHQASPKATIWDFTDDVIEPLAGRMAEDKFMAKRAAVIAAHTPRPSRATAKNLLGVVPMLGTLFALEDKTQKVRLDAELAWLETRRLPLKQELRDLLVARTVRTDDGFAFCADGRQRRYRIIDGVRFSRMEDGSEVCEVTELHSLTRDKPAP